MEKIFAAFALALLVGCASQNDYSGYSSSKYYEEESEEPAYSKGKSVPNYLAPDDDDYSSRPSYRRPAYQSRYSQEEAPSKPTYRFADQDKKSNLVCAEQWVSCGVQPVGSLIQSTQRSHLYSFWKTACTCGESCGCIDERAAGEGFARWYNNPNGCCGSDLYGAASGRLQNGQFARINGRILVTISTAKGLFHGEIHSDGTYQSGVMEQLGGDEKFIGRFNPDGSYQSGALYTKGQVILADQFNGKTPLGRVLIGDGSGRFVEQECDHSGCHVLQQDSSPFISELFSAMSQNAAQDIAIRGVLTALGKEALLMHPAFRAFAFLQNVFDIVAVANKNLPSNL